VGRLLLRGVAPGRREGVQSPASEEGTGKAPLARAPPHTEPRRQPALPVPNRGMLRARVARPVPAAPPRLSPSIKIQVRPSPVNLIIF